MNVYGDWHCGFPLLFFSSASTFISQIQNLNFFDSYSCVERDLISLCCFKKFKKKKKIDRWINEQTNYTPRNEVVGGYAGFTMSVRL
jgi:hypothetical protein